MDSEKITKVFGYALSLCAPAVFGWVAGFFVGQSDSQAVILAAVLPVVLSGIGIVFAFRPTDNTQHHIRIVASLFMILFSVSLYFGAQEGKYRKGLEEKDNLNKALKAKSAAQLNQRQARFDYLQNCSDAELKINEFRKELLKLPPLESSVFCR